jgi:hypothetical protein
VGNLVFQVPDVHFGPRLAVVHVVRFAVSEKPLARPDRRRLANYSWSGGAEGLDDPLLVSE